MTAFIPRSPSKGGFPKGQWCAFCGVDTESTMWSCDKCRERARMIVEHDDKEAKR